MSKKTIESRPYPKLVVINGRDQNQLRGVATPEYLKDMSGHFKRKKQRTAQRVGKSGVASTESVRPLIINQETYYYQFYPGTEETWVDDKEEYIKSMQEHIKQAYMTLTDLKAYNQ